MTFKLICQLKRIISREGGKIKLFLFFKFIHGFKNRYDLVKKKTN